MSAERWTWFRSRFCNPSFSIESRNLSAVPWYKNFGGRLGLCSTSTSSECPWQARIFVLSSLKWYRFLLFVYNCLKQYHINFPDMTIHIGDKLGYICPSVLVMAESYRFELCLRRRLGNLPVCINVSTLFPALLIYDITRGYSSHRTYFVRIIFRFIANIVSQSQPQSRLDK